jgi:hypothetical protein
MNDPPLGRDNTALAIMPWPGRIFNVKEAGHVRLQLREIKKVLAFHLPI